MDEESTGGMFIPPGITIALGRWIPWRKGYSAGNYQIIDNESTRGMGFRWKLPAHGRGIHPKKAILLGITSSLTLIHVDKIKMPGKSYEQ
jgi:hypothetical protein